MEGHQAHINWNYMQKEDVLEILEEHRNNFEWREGEHVLDIGCGPGDITESALLPMLPNYSVLVGSDVSPEMVEYCNKFRKRERLSFKVLDIQQQDLGVDWEWETFDKIFSFYCLHWLHEYSHAMKNIYALLRYNGDILLLFLTPDNPVHIAFQELKTMPKWKRFLKNIKWFYEADDPVTFIQTKLREVGFQEINCLLKFRSSRYHSWAALLELIKAVNPYTCHIPAELHSECLLELMEILKQERLVLEDPNTGAVIVEYNIIVAMAKKL